MTHERLLEYLHYDPEIGIFTWIKRLTVKTKVGSVAGVPRNGKKNYIIISFDRWPYYAHRLAWFYMRGEWPLLIDHKDRNEMNNRFKNLRNVNQFINMSNTKVFKTNTSGYPGVSYVGYGRWQARMNVNGKFTFIGAFGSFEEAVVARKQAELDTRGELV